MSDAVEQGGLQIQVCRDRNGATVAFGVAINEEIHWISPDGAVGLAVAILRGVFGSLGISALIETMEESGAPEEAARGIAIAYSRVEDRVITGLQSERLSESGPEEAPRVAVPRQSASPFIIVPRDVRRNN